MCHIIIIGLKQIPFLILGLNNARIPTGTPAAHMSTGPAGGAGGGRENLVYFAVIGTTCIGAGIYVSKLKQSYMLKKRQVMSQESPFYGQAHYLFFVIWLSVIN